MNNSFRLVTALLGLGYLPQTQMEAAPAKLNDEVSAAGGTSIWNGSTGNWANSAPWNSTLLPNNGDGVLTTRAAHPPPAPTSGSMTPANWASIYAAYEAARHAAFAVEGGHQARNPAQQWRTKFDGRGFTTQPDKGGWQWGLELRAYGFGDRKCNMNGSPEVRVEGQRVTYVWDANLQEWFVNDQRGLEHGFTIAQRPASGTGPEALLIFDLAVRGSLRPEITTDEQTARFIDEKGAAVVNYTGLAVWDADGRALRAHLEVPADGPCDSLRVSVEERDAHYPLTIDPVAQQAFLFASVPGDQDQAGYSVAISGDTVVVGAPYEDSNATGVNGDPNNNNAQDSGAAYVFVRNGTSWSQQAYLKASNTDRFYSFGSSVAISGDTVIVGSFGEASNATGVNGNQNDHTAPRAGAVYVFERSGTNWSQQAYLKASNTDAGDEFGGSVAISDAQPGKIVVVGARGESSNATGVNGNQSDNSAEFAGAAYVFVRTGGTWSQEAYLKASNTDAFDLFAQSVAITRAPTAEFAIVVGAPQEASNATGVNGNQNDNSAKNAGAAYAFRRNNNAHWSQRAYLKASNTDAGDLFGWPVSIEGDFLVAGARREASSATGVNGNQSDNSAPGAGAAYVFSTENSSWAQEAYLKASNTHPNDEFGCSVVINGTESSSGSVIVGAHNESSNATGVNGNQFGCCASRSGAAYRFIRYGIVWTQSDYLKADLILSGAFFGESVAFSSDQAVIGARYALGAGGAYVFGTALGNYFSIPPLSTDLDFGEIRVKREGYIGFFISNMGATDLRIDSIGLNRDVPGVTIAATAGGIGGVTFPYTIPASPPQRALHVELRWTPPASSDLDAYVNPRIELQVRSSDPIIPIAEYRVRGRALEAEAQPEETFLGWLFSLNGAPRQSGPSSVPDGSPQTATFVRDPDVPQSMMAGAPSFLGGGSVQLSNFDGTMTVSMLSLPGDPEHKLIRIEGGSMTAPSVQLPSGAMTGLNHLTFGPPEQSDGILDVATGNYTASATGTIVNDLLPDGVTVRGSYSGVYNAQTGKISVQSQSEDLFEAKDRLLNISTRIRVQTGDNVLIGGFIIAGRDPKKVIIRGIGPSLSSSIAGALADPTLELFQGSTLLATNDNWRTDQEAEIQASGIPPTNDLESAIVRTLAPGAYTAVLHGNGNTTGIGLVEAYDIERPARSRLANISTRGFVESGDNVMIGGLIVSSATGASATAVVRAIGPSLGNFGIEGALQDTTLDLVNSNGTVIRSNNDWRESQETEIIATGLQPSDDRESTLIETLLPGSYTAIVRGAGNTEGVGLVEAYHLQ